MLPGTQDKFRHRTGGPEESGCACDRFFKIPDRTCIIGSPLIGIQAIKSLKPQIVVGFIPATEVLLDDRPFGISLFRKRYRSGFADHGYLDLPGVLHFLFDFLGDLE